MRLSILSLVISALLLTGCGSKSIQPQLAEVDSLIVAELNDSAYHVVLSIDEQGIIKSEDRAHYNLLMTQTSLLANKPLPSDSLLDEAIRYYQEVHDSEHLADAYYYKGASLYLNHDIQQSLLFYKKAETEIGNSGNVRLRYKIAEALSYINSVNSEYKIALSYATKALKLCDDVHNKRWLADAHFRAGMVYSQIEQYDSALYHFHQIEPVLRYVRTDDLPYMLCNLGMVYLNDDPQKAREYFQKSLSYKEATRPLEFLADMAYEEGHKEEAYHLWKRAMTINDLAPKDNIIHNLLEYDIEHGKTDDVCDQVNEIIAIKDSIINKVKNDTIRDLQIRFDHQVEMNAVNKRLIVWQWILGGVGFLVLILVGYIIWKKHKTKFQKLAFELQIRKLGIDLLSLKNSVAEANCQISDLKLENSQKQEEIKTLECSNDNAEKQIKELKTVQNLNQQKIAQLEKVKEEAILEAREIDEKLKTWQGKEAYKVTRGAYLYDKVLVNQKINLWTPADYEAFISYYEIGHYKEIRKIRRKYDNLTQRNLLYLILVDMGKDTDEISNIMSIEKQSIRSMRFRIEHNGKRL